MDNLKAIKSNNALIYDIMWNLSDLIPVSRRDPSLYLSLYIEYNKSAHGVVFSWIRNKILRRFSFNVKNSAERYLGLAYSMEEVIDGISDIGNLERYLKVIKDAVS